jgi:hypothetical protein
VTLPRSFCRRGPGPRVMKSRCQFRRGGGRRRRPGWEVACSSTEGSWRLRCQAVGAESPMSSVFAVSPAPRSAGPCGANKKGGDKGGAPRACTSICREILRDNAGLSRRRSGVRVPSLPLRLRW